MKKAKKEKEQPKKINTQNELIIGLTPKQTPNNKKPKIEKEKNTKKITKTKTKKAINKKQKENKNKALKIFKWTSIIIIIVTAIILFLTSSFFNIKEIEVVNNNIISKEEIIRLSTLKIETNMFKYSNKTIRNGIKENAYVESVQIKRNLNGTVSLNIVERKPTYMLQLENSYAYINNQGYILEVTEIPIQTPVITGYKTLEDQIKEGNRLIITDLEKLEDVIKIMNSTKEVELEDKITSIDIENKNNYVLEITSENKKVQFGEATNINVKLLKIKEILELEKDVSGIIYFQDAERTVFKESV